MANPTWFDVEEYLANKLNQLNAIDADGGWTEDTLVATLKENGYEGEEGAYQHFIDFGADENISPNSMFNVAEYLADKADQLNELKVDGKTSWDSASVFDAITAAGMNVWEHYVQFGSAEGVNPSNDFDTAGYIIAKTQLMNETSEGGRSNWTFAEVQAAFAENGLSALEHYNQFGLAEFKAAGQEDVLAEAIGIDPEDQIEIDDDFNPYTGVKTYTNLEAALDAQKDGSLAARYAITDAEDAGNVTVAQQAGIAALLAGATPAITTKPTYTLIDTVSALEDASTTVLVGAEHYEIKDTLGNIAAGDDALVNGAGIDENSGITGTIVFGAKAESVVTTTVKYADIDGKELITLTHADKAVTDAEGTLVWTNKGDAVVAVDGNGATAIGSAEESFDLNDVFILADAVDNESPVVGNVTFNVIGSSKNDYITAHNNGGVITGGLGADMITLAEAGESVVVDTLKYVSLKDSTADSMDVVTNFESGDKIDVKSISSKAMVAADVEGSISNGVLTLDEVSDLTAAITAANNAVTAKNTAVVFSLDNSTYFFMQGGSTDLVIQLEGTEFDSVSLTGTSGVFTLETPDA